MRNIAVLLLFLSISLFSADKNKPVTENDIREFIEQLGKECLKGKAMYCQMAGEYYSVGKESDRDFHKAAQYMRQGCKLNVTLSCAHLAYYYENGLGVRQDIIEAHEYYGQACDLGDQQSCSQYARINKQGY